MLDLLLIDDNPTDILLTQIAFEDAGVAALLHTVSDGVDGLAFLRREAGFEQTARPDAVLLDLNMPRMNGLEVLEAMKADPDLAGIPVFLLLASASEVEVWEARQLRADGYLPKPVDPATVLALLEAGAS